MKHGASLTYLEIHPTYENKHKTLWRHFHLTEIWHSISKKKKQMEI